MRITNVRKMSVYSIELSEEELNEIVGDLFATHNPLSVSSERLVNDWQNRRRD